MEDELKATIVRLLFVAVIIAAILAPVMAFAGTAWNDLRVGNPVLPGYFADPCCRKFGDTYYLYVTPDGWGVGEAPACTWTSKDFVHWTPTNITWPNTPSQKWAPSVLYKNGKYYMYSQVPCVVYVATAPTPLGPWTNPIAGGNPLVPNNMPSGTCILDGEIFIDDDGQAYLYYGCWWTPTVLKLNKDLISYDPSTILKFYGDKAPKGTVQGCMEAPYMLKHNGKYYYMYSNDQCFDSTYKVEYSVGDSPLGPWTYGKNNPILSTNDDDTVDGPGHHTILEDNGRVYIVYHRHDNPHHPDGVHRQTAIDELHFLPDGSIEKVVPSHSGVGYLAPSTVRDTNLVPGCKATASSYAGENFVPAYAADENNGTLWKASSYKYPQWLQVDLGKSMKVNRVETDFQFVQFSYKYVIEYSNDAKTWKNFADRSKNTDSGSMIDKKDATGRYFRITILGDNTPQRPNPEIAIWNLKIYDGIDKPNQAPNVDIGSDVTCTSLFPTRTLDAFVQDDGLPNGPVSVKWTKVSGPGEVKFEHPDRAYTKVTFGGVGDYVLKLTANDGKLTGSGTVKYKILPPGDELIWYKFDEKAGAIANDSSINRQYGVMNVQATRSPGMNGGAINMSGNDSVSVPAFGTVDKLTVAAWVNLHTLNGDTCILCSNGEDKAALKVCIAGSGDICLVINGQPAASSNFRFDRDNMGLWKHVAVEYDSAAKTASFFVNGKLDCTKQLENAPKLDLSAGSKIGARAAGLRGLDGEIDDFRAYAKAISADTIADLAKPAKFTSISDAKKLADGSPVLMMAKAVTYAPTDPIDLRRSTDSFYISERDGSDGILVKDGNAGQDRVRQDVCVSFSGIVKTGNNGEKYIELTNSPTQGAPFVVKASNNAMAAGLLVKFSADVKSVAEDGSSIEVSNAAHSLKVMIDKGLIIKKLSAGNSVDITAVISAEGSANSPVLLAKDIVRTNPPSKPLIAWYKFDEGEGDVAKDSSGCGADAQLVNGAAWDQGQIGKALSLDGQRSYVQLPNLGLVRELTITFWINLNSLGNDSWSTAVVHEDSWNLSDLHMQIPGKDGYICGPINGVGDVASKFRFVGNTGKWVHVAYACDPKDRRLYMYINGKLDSTGSMFELRPINLTHCKLGSWGGGGRFLDGKIDDLRIYDKALTADEIAEIYNEK